jgi:hypothetical protein
VPPTVFPGGLGSLFCVMPLLRCLPPFLMQAD